MCEYSDEVLLEVVSDTVSYTLPRRVSGGSIYSHNDDTRSVKSEYKDNELVNYQRTLSRPASFPTSHTPLLLNHIDI